MDRIIKQRVVLYRPDGTPFEATPYTRAWSIENGGISGGNSGIDGVVQTATIQLKNNVETNNNFNPEAEMGVNEWVVIPLVGNGGNIYPGVPSGYIKGTASFNIIKGNFVSWDNLPSTWDSWTEWALTDDTDNSDLYGEILVVGSNFVTPKSIPGNVYFEIGLRRVDYSQRNPVNTYNDNYAPLLDEDTKAEIYLMHQVPQWMNYRWYADGTNLVPNPTGGTPLVNAIGVMKSVDLKYKTWDSLPSTWDSWTEWDEDTGDSEYFTTQASYDPSTDKIVLGKTPDTGEPLDLSITYYTEEPELIFSGYLGDDIEPIPEEHSINLTLRDKGRRLQQTMIDGVFITVEPSGWTEFEESKTVTSIIEIGSAFNVINHGYDIGDPIRIRSTGTLPKTDGVEMTGIYTVESIIDNNTFTLKDVNITSVGTGTITSTLYVMNIEDIIQNILDDALGNGAVTLYTDYDFAFDKKLGVTTDIWDSRTAWDSIQHLASLKGLYLSYLFNDSTQDFELTLKTIVSKTTADFDFEQSNIYAQTQKSTGNEIRNSIAVAYNSSETGKYEAVSSVDQDSVDAYGTRASLITEASTSGINTEKKAQEFADLILENSKDKINENIVTTPILYKKDTHGRININDTASFDYKYLDNQENGNIPFFAIESYAHNFNADADNSRDKFFSEWRGNRQKVRTSKKRYLEIESRPGAFKQVIGRDLSERYPIPSVEDIKIQSTGLETTSLDPRAFCVVQFNRPANYFPAHYILEWRKDGEPTDYSTGEQRKIVGTENDIYSERIILDPKTDYYFRVTAWSRGNVKGVVSLESTINAIGDLVAPNNPTGLSVVGLDESLQINFNPNTEGDLLGYVIYYRKDSAPTKDSDFRADDGSYDGKKETNSLKTVISGLDPGTWHIGVTAFDSSGNESTLSSTVETENTPVLVIRTQEQMDAYVEETSFTVPQAYTPKYNTVKVVAKDTPYTMSADSSDPSNNPLTDTFRIERDDFSIIGIGNPVIELYLDSGSPNWIQCEKGEFSGITWIGKDVGVGIQKFFKIIDDSVSNENGLIEITKNTFIGTDTTVFSVTTNGNSKMLVSKNKFIDHILSNTITDGLTKGFYQVIGNRFIDTIETSGYNERIRISEVSSTVFAIENISIEGNEIYNGYVQIRTVNGTTIKSLNVNDNKFIQTVSSSVNKILLGNSAFSLHNSNFDRNIIEGSANFTGDFIFLFSTGSGTLTNVSVANNSNKVTLNNWLNYSPGAMTVTGLSKKSNKPVLIESETTTTSTTATAGAQTLPTNPTGFLTKEINGTIIKIPYYNN